jgi:CheY-like chemotaxis protein
LVANVLVVDDDPSVRRVVERIVRSQGHEAFGASSGREALALLEFNSFDLIVTDINMPDMDGIELILAVRERGRTTPMIAISGGGLVDANSLLKDAQVLGAVEIVNKPFPVTEMRDVIARHLNA